MSPDAGQTALFWVCAVLSVLGGLGTVASRKAVHSALFLALTMISLALIYIAQDAIFLGMVQVIVYTGAVMMLFVFVLMVVGVDASDSLVETIRGQRFLAVVAFVGFLGLLLAGLASALDGRTVVGLEQANAEHGGNTQGIGALLFTRYLLAFEVTAALLITAAVGAMVLTHRERVTARKTQAELAAERFAGPEHPGNLPSPGVYARNNAVDMPALLPDGSTSEISVPSPMRLRGQARDADRLALDEAAHLTAHQAVAVDDGAVDDGAAADGAQT